MGKIAGKIFFTSKKNHSNQSPAASSRCLQGTPSQLLAISQKKPLPIDFQLVKSLSLSRYLSLNLPEAHIKMGIKTGMLGSIFICTHLEEQHNETD